MRKGKEKYNDACIKIFNMLRLLAGGTAQYKNIIAIFKPDANKPAAGAHVILNKYLNTLKVFGINIYKTKNIYYLQNSFFSLNLNKNDVKMLKLLKEAGEGISNNKNRALFQNFIRDIEMKLTSTSRELLLNSSDEQFSKQNDYYYKYREIIEKCETYCMENYKIEVSFTQDNKDYKIICDPREVTYVNKKAYLSIFNNLSRQVFEVPIDTITSVKQIPFLTKGNDVGITVVYQIKNNLAKAYNLKEWETSTGEYDKDGWLTIINTNENFELLIKRLMRYNSNCRIVSPKNVKEMMVSAIDKTLANYE